MSVYYFVFVLTFLIAWQLSGKADKDYLRSLFIIFLPLFFYGAIRVDFGIDYHTYEELYDEFHGLSISEIDKDQHAEVGYQVLNMIMPTWRSLVILQVCILYLAFIVLFKTALNRKNILLAICLLFLAGNFSIITPLVTMRNGLANAILMLSFPLIRDRKILPVAILTLLGGTLHSSLMLYMPLAYLAGRRQALTLGEIKFFSVILVAVVVLGSSAILKYSLNFMMDNFDRYEHMVEEVSNGPGYATLLAGSANLTILGIIAYVSYINREVMSPGDNCLMRIGMLYLLGVFMGPFGGARWQSYFVPFLIINAANMYSYKWNSKELKIFFYALIFAYFAYNFFYIWQWNNPRFYVFQHYHSIFD